MSRPIARHADGSDCYTVGCTLGQHTPLDREREAFVQEGLNSRGILTIEQLRQRDEERKQAEFKQEWKERARGWKELGFQYPASVRKADHWVKYATAGKQELAHLSDRQRRALRFFTTNNYRWINDHLYGRGAVLPSGGGKSFEEHEFAAHNRYFAEENPTIEQVGELLPVLDEALAAKKDRASVVYRGVSRKALASVLSAEKWQSDEEFHAYVDENFKPGAEVEMAGYLSASPSPKAALGYASAAAAGTGSQKEGIFFELLTRSGVNISGISEFAREAETLLPRGTRWKVAAVHKSKTLRHAENDPVPNASRKARPSTATVTLIQLVEIED